MMTIQESVNRAFNLLAVSIVALSGFAFLPEVFLENDWPDKLDDAALFILGAFAIYWYNRGRNKFSRSMLPLILVLVALVVKIGAIVIEFADPASVGDDFGALILFVLASVLCVYQYQKAAKLAAS